MGPSRPSIHDVAARAGVSVTTVSHAVSGNRPVSESTRQRVLAAMAELGYQPSHAAAALKTGRSNTIAVLVPDITNPFNAELALGVEQAARERGFDMILVNTGFDPELESSHLSMIARRAVDGLVYAAGSSVGARPIEEVAVGFPVVLADEELASGAFDTVISDNLAGGALVGAHLAALGHRRVLVVTGPASLLGCQDRLAGFRSRFPHEVLVVEGDFRQRSGTEAVRAHPPRAAAYTAVFALNDLMAFGAVQALREAGLAVPADVSVVGYDDVPTASLITPGLTTVRQPTAAIGRQAALRLLDRITGAAPPGAVERTVLPVELRVRASTGSA